MPGGDGLRHLLQGVQVELPGGVLDRTRLVEGDLGHHVGQGVRGVDLTLGDVRALELDGLPGEFLG
jgi:hypothetical protein